ILHRGATQDELVRCLQQLYSFRSLCIRVLYCLAFIQNHVPPLKLNQMFQIVAYYAVAGYNNIIVFEMFVVKFPFYTIVYMVFQSWGKFGQLTFPVINEGGGTNDKISAAFVFLLQVL